MIGELLMWGCLAGLMGGILGIGGGLIFVLILPNLLIGIGVKPIDLVAFTVSNSLFATLFTTLSVNIKLWSNKYIFFREVCLISASGILASLLVLKFMVNNHYYQKEVFDAVFVLMMLYTMVRLLISWSKTRNKVEKTEIVHFKKLPLILTGLAAGVVSPLSGMGGGVVIVPTLHSFFGFPIKQANSISMGVICITAFFSTCYNFFGKPVSITSLPHVGFIILPIALSLSFGGMIGSYMGYKISSRLKPGILTLLFAGFLFVMIIKRVFFQ